MSLDVLVEFSLVAIPSLIFIVLVAYLRKATNTWLNVGEFRGMLVIFAMRTAWSAFRTIVSELDGAKA